jgi:hypothetical protein
MPRTYQPKAVTVQCRRCIGQKVEKGTTEKCHQCAGKGTEKLTPKAIRRWILKNTPPPIVTKTEKVKENNDEQII